MNKFCKLCILVCIFVVGFVHSWTDPKITVNEPPEARTTIIQYTVGSLIPNIGVAIYSSIPNTPLNGTVAYAVPNTACSVITNNVTGKICLVDRGQVLNIYVIFFY